MLGYDSEVCRYESSAGEYCETCEAVEGAGAMILNAAVIKRR